MRGPGDGVRRLPEGEGGGKPPRFQRFIEIDSIPSKHAWLPEVTGGFTGLRSAADPSLTFGDVYMSLHGFHRFALPPDPHSL